MLLLSSIFFWLFCFYLNRTGIIIPKIGGGCFQSKKRTQYSPQDPVQLPTAEDLFGRATAWGRREMPLAYGAREGALADLGRGTDFYNQFQPTSIESALGNQYFQNIMPDLKRSIRHSLSLSGMANSPALAEQTARAIGRVGFDVGSYLANQGNERARYSLGSRLAIDPYRDVYGRYFEADQNQSNSQAQLQQQYNEQRAMADYLTDQERYERDLAKARSVGFFSPLAGAAMGGWDVGLESAANWARTFLPMLSGAMSGGAAGGSGGFGGGQFNWGQYLPRWGGG